MCFPSYLSVSLFQGHLHSGSSRFASKWIGGASSLESLGIDETGSISPQGRKCQSLHHIFSVEENGIDFDFSASQAKRSRRVVKWEDMDFLPKLGMHFDAEQLEDIPLPSWFGASPASTGHIEALPS